MIKKVNAFDIREQHFIVGRSNEITMFSCFLDHMGSHRKNIWNLYGTGGIGKSTLLRVFRLLAYQHDSCYLMLDSKDFNHTGDDLLSALLEQIQVSAGQCTSAALFEKTIEAIREISLHRKVILAFDTFEELTGLETWLRDPGKCARPHCRTPSLKRAMALPPCLERKNPSHPRRTLESGRLVRLFTAMRNRP